MWRGAPPHHHRHLALLLPAQYVRYALIIAAPIASLVMFVLFMKSTLRHWCVWTLLVW